MSAPNPQPSRRPLRGRAFLVAALGAGVLAFAWAFFAKDSAGTAPERAAPARKEPAPGPGGGRFRPAPVDPGVQQQIDDLNGIGYVSGTQAASDHSGVTKYDPAHALAGTNLYTSGHAPVAILIDMEGRELHRWQAEFQDAWPGEKLSDRRKPLVQFWRRAFLLPNGDLLAIYEGYGLVKLDKDSKVVWRSRCGAHHDLALLPDGDLLVLTREAHVVPAIDPERAVLEDFVSRLDANGVEKQRFSLVEALDTPASAELHARALAQREDILHTNSITVLDGRLASKLPAFRAGNLLLSSRKLSFLSVVDPASGRTEWTLAGAFKHQHDPKVLENGNLLVFDNEGLDSEARNASRVLELDPASAATVWEYRGNAKAPFFSETCGTADRLQNGNTLITESDGGRAFEVTREGEIVWEFWNPAHVTSKKGELIATLFELVRLPAEQPWLTR